MNADSNWIFAIILISQELQYKTLIDNERRKIREAWDVSESLSILHIKLKILHIILYQLL